MCSECHAPLSDGANCLATAVATPAACHPEALYVLGAAGNYSDEKLQALIHGLKFNYVKDAAEPLGKLLVAYVAKINLDIADFIVVPIPLSRRRLRLRGFNQSELIANHFAKAFALPIETQALARIKHAMPQSETKSAAERKENIRGAFAVVRPELIRGKHILLIDDVSTSGATFREASLALKAAGVEKILALAVAKT